MKDCIIIGAGFSGLTIGNLLFDKDIDFSILEASNRIGGRVYSIDFKENKIELGARYIGDEQTEIIKLLDYYKLGKQQVKKAGAMLLRNKGETIRLHSDDIGSSHELTNLYEQIEKLAAEIDFINYENSTQSKKFDEITVIDWLKTKNLNEEEISEVRGFCHGLLCSEPEDVSLLSLLWYVSSSKGLFNAVDHEEGLLKYIANDTLTELALNLSNDFQDRIQFDSQVLAVNAKKNHFEVITSKGRVYSKTVAFAIPPSALSRVVLPDTILEKQKRAFFEFKPGNAFACFAIFENAFWKEKGLSGTIVGDGWISTTFDVSNELQEIGILDCMISPNKSIEFSRLSIDKQKKFIQEDLRCYFNDETLKPLEIFVGNWHNEFPSFGSFGWKLAPGFLSNHYMHMKSEVPNLFFAGTEFSDEFPGYVEGAIRSGIKQASKILETLDQR